jgi:hypothetical protein
VVVEMLTTAGNTRLSMGARVLPGTPALDAISGVHASSISHNSRPYSSRADPIRFMITSRKWDSDGEAGPFGPGSAIQ